MKLQDIGVNGGDVVLYEKYETALNSFLKKEKSSEIILCGSLAENRIHQDSDIDLFIINDTLDEIADHEIIENNIVISVHSCSLEAIQRIIEEEKKQFIRKYSGYISTGIVLTGTHSYQVLQLAKYTMSFPVPTLTEAEIEKIKEYLKKYTHLADYYFQHTDSLSLNIRFDGFIQEIVRYYFMLNRELIPYYKNIAEKISDTQFIDCLNAYFSSNLKEDKLYSINNINRYVDSLLVKYITYL